MAVLCGCIYYALTEWKVCAKRLIGCLDGVLCGVPVPECDIRRFAALHFTHGYNLEERCGAEV